MHVAVVRIELHIPAARSLKEKRAVVKPVIEGIRHRFSLSVAETDYQDKWQRAEIGVAVVSSTPAQADRGGRLGGAVRVEPARRRGVRVQDDVAEGR